MVYEPFTEQRYYDAGSGVGRLKELRKDSNVDAKEGKVKASVETMAYYNMILTEAIFQLLKEKGLLTRQEVKDRIEKLKAETKLSFRMIHLFAAAATFAYMRLSPSSYSASTPSCRQLVCSCASGRRAAQIAAVALFVLPCISNTTCSCPLSRQPISLRVGTITPGDRRTQGEYCVLCSPSVDEGRKRTLAIVTAVLLVPRLGNLAWDGRSSTPSCESFLMSALGVAERILAVIDQRYPAGKTG